MARLSVAWAALLGLAACGGVPNDVPETMDLRTQQAFEARRATLLGEPIPEAAPELATEGDDIAQRAAAAIDAAEREAGSGEAPTTPSPSPVTTPPATATGAAAAAPAGRGLPALPADDDTLALPSGGAAPADDSAPGCAQFDTAGAAQNWFIANGGPTIDPDGLDPDGDGRVCGWTPPTTGG